MRRLPRSRRTVNRIPCPFCQELLPAPTPQERVFSGFDCQGGRCGCGAAFAIDETGRLGGQAQIDALAIACDGDLERALALSPERDYRLEILSLRPDQGRFGLGFSRRDPAAPKIWVVRLKAG